MLLTAYAHIYACEQGVQELLVGLPHKKAKQILPLLISQLENIECSNRRVEEGDRLYTVQTVPWLYTVQCTARNWLLAILLTTAHRSTLHRRKFGLISCRNKKIL